MKLKKVASLALAGVMAVSMLAGCAGKDATTPDTDDNTAVTVVTTADAMNAVQDSIEFKTSTTLDAYLAAAAKKAIYSEVDAAGATPAGLGRGNVYDAVKAAAVGKYTMSNTYNFGATATSGKTTRLYLFTVDGAVSQESAVNAVARVYINPAYFPQYTDVQQAGSGNTYYTGHKATYTGEVSCVKVTKTNDEGKTASAYYILYSVTQDIASTTTNLDLDV